MQDVKIGSWLRGCYRKSTATRPVEEEIIDTLENLYGKRQSPKDQKRMDLVRILSGFYDQDRGCM